jgi:hypothetical protein
MTYGSDSSDIEGFVTCRLTFKSLTCLTEFTLGHVLHQYCLIFLAFCCFYRTVFARLPQAVRHRPEMFRGRRSVCQQKEKNVHYTTHANVSAFDDMNELIRMKNVNRLKISQIIDFSSKSTLIPQ